MGSRFRTTAEGFSVLEVIVVLVIVALALTIALPMFNARPQNLAADLQDFTLNLQVARELGVSRTMHYRVSVSGTRYSMQRCDPTQANCALDASWTTERTISLRPNISFATTPTPANAEFDTRGFLALETGQSAPLTFTLRDAVRNWTKSVTVNAAGMVDTR
jgi:prepilin-type N-terminal cleavage/methylation domain-containing protein